MIKDGIEVYVRRTGRGTRYLEYEREKPKFNSNTSIAYIKATTGEQFEVRIKLRYGFRYYTASGIQVRLCLDANEAPDVYWHPKRHLPIAGWETKISDFSVQVGNEWQAGKLAFGNVDGEPSPNPFDDPELVAARRRRLGTIRVSIQRGHVNSEDAPAPSIETSTPTPQAYDHTSISDSDRAAGITHKVTTVDGLPIAEPESDQVTRFKAIGGLHGERLHFEFRYRSLAELTRLGLCDENGRIFRPKSEEDEDEDEEDNSPIPPVSRRRFSPPLGLRIGQRRSTRNRSRRSPPPVLSPERVNTPESVGGAVSKNFSPADVKFSGVEKPARRVDASTPATETEEERIARFKRLLASGSQVMDRTSGPGQQSILRPIKRGQLFDSQSPEPAKKPRLLGAKMPTDPRSIIPAARSKLTPGDSNTTVPHMQGSDIGTFSSKVKREPSIEIVEEHISRHALSVPAGAISNMRSGPSGPSVPSSLKVSSHVVSRTDADAPTARLARPQEESAFVTKRKMSTEELGIQFRALDVEKELLALKKKRADINQHIEESEFELRKLKAEQEVARMRKEERLAAGGKID